MAKTDYEAVQAWLGYTDDAAHQEDAGADGVMASRSRRGGRPDSRQGPGTRQAEGGQRERKEACVCWLVCVYVCCDTPSRSLVSVVFAPFPHVPNRLENTTFRASTYQARGRLRYVTDV